MHPARDTTSDASVGSVADERPSWSLRVLVGTAAVCGLVFAFLALAARDRSYLVFSLDDTRLLLLSGVVGGASSGLAALVADARRRSRSPHTALSRARSYALRAVLALASLVAVPFAWLVLVFSGAVQYTSLGVIDGREYVAREVTFDESSITLYERHGLEIKPLRTGGASMADGTPFADGDVVVSRAGETVEVALPAGQITFVPGLLDDR
ncbi:hypothetical protein EDF38_3105 [Frigoribacterium sp. PhB160]|uniref:hypothetical protein n=1 Tax=Frigoribacterium sp. PhB160 TaxID=2485192 RepID=UPI000F46D734|nr:hypothetical protein [Frigoribacterium sp. PhB160]ROS58360.1 hypothetical protein EDF38_3105 [Frigoribacterium sp. PhB160]